MNDTKNDTIKNAELKRIQSETARNLAEEKEIKSRSSLMGIILRYGIPIVISVIAIWGYYWSVLKPALDEKETYREYQLKNAEMRLKHHSDSLSIAIKELHAIADSLQQELIALKTDYIEEDEELKPALSKIQTKYNTYIEKQKKSLNKLDKKIKEPIITEEKKAEF